MTDEKTVDGKSPLNVPRRSGTPETTAVVRPCWLDHRRLSTTRKGTTRLWAKLKRGYQKFRDDTPGERFLKSHERWKHRSKSPAATIVIAGSGIILIVGGFLLGLIPGVPGIVLGVLGFAMIATRFRRLAIWLDVCEVKARQTWKRFRRILAR